MFSPETFFPVLERVTGLLDQCGIRFHLTGGLVAVYYAEPRLTQDADLVVDPEQLAEHLEKFIEGLEQLNYVFDPTVVRTAVARGRMFQIIDSEECLKIDFYPRELVPGSLDRSFLVDLTPQLQIPIASRPDVVVSKLVWISKGSHKSRRDVRQLVRGASDEEVRTIREFTAELSLEPLLDEVLAEPDEIDLDD